MKYIPLTQGQISIVDDEDYDNVILYKWHARYDKETKSFYAGRRVKENGKTVNILLHRFILGMERGNKLVVDHINHNTLDNSKQNLRTCTVQQNAVNTPKRAHNKSGYKGVHSRGSRWIAQIMYMGKKINLGSFKTAEEASNMYQRKTTELNGEFVYVSN